ncbi:hypothetical protein AAHZ94_09815 [Streptomyces sp. HSW2009]|uniref:hypothetical protein n=1 Tax=Streptomyces sp. HSW2009 TaxID=3142890 RepID=UPI0032EE34E4
MYLVHVHLTADSRATLPEGAAALITECVGHDEAVEHVVVHPAARGHVVVGVFVIAPSLAVAEAVAEAVCRRALHGREQWRGFTLTDCGVPFVASYYESVAGTARGGRLMPRHDPSSGDPFPPFC